MYLLQTWTLELVKWKKNLKYYMYLLQTWITWTSWTKTKLKQCYVSITNLNLNSLNKKIKIRSSETFEHETWKLITFIFLTFDLCLCIITFMFLDGFRDVDVLFGVF